MAISRKKIMTGLAGLISASVLAGCSLVAPVPFTSSVASPAAESAQTPGVHAAGVKSRLGENLGISAGNTILWESTDVRQRKLQAVADSGARWFEFDVDWNSVQDGGPTSFMWDATDRVVRDARARGLKVLGMVGYTPAWARPANCPAGSDKCLPASPETFAAFARAVAERYGTRSPIADLRGGIAAVQIWNEPNLSQFAKPKIDPVMYTRVLKRAYVEIKKVDPSITVIAGGTAPAGNDPSGENMAPTRFLNRIYDNGGKGFFDAFAHHPYSFPCNPLQKASWNAFTQTKFIYDTMKLNGDGAKKVWGTEAGAPTGADVGPCAATGGKSVTEAMQSQFVLDYFKGWYGDFGKFTGPLFWFQIQDNGTDPMYYDDHFGLLRRDFTPKPAYRTLQRLAQA